MFCLILLSLLMITQTLDTSKVYFPPKHLDVHSVSLWDLHASDDILDKISLDEYLLKLVDNFKEEMIKGIPEINIPVLDPFKKPIITINVNEKNANLEFTIRNLTITGFSKFVVDELHTSIKYLNISFVLRLPEIIAKGHYYLDGKVIKIVPLRGNGAWWLEMDNLSMAVTASLDITADEKFRMGDNLHIKLDFESIRMDFENLMGDGQWTKVVMKILNDLGRTLFNKFEPDLIGNIRDSLRTLIDNELKKLPIKAIKPGSTANEYVDQILQNVRDQLIHHKMEPMQLPDYVYNFNKTVFFVTTYGEAKLYDGWLQGASTIHRTGDCILNATDEVAVLGANLGLNDLNITYKGHAKFMGMGPTITGGGSIANVAFYLQIEQPSATGSNPILTSFNVTDMSTIWIELSGLGPLTWILKWLLTGLTKLMEDFIVEKMTQYIQIYVSDQLKEVSFPIG